MPAPIDVFWLSAFLDLPADSFHETAAFWSAVTGYAVSPPRGEAGEFATLIPPDGDDYLRVQRIGDPEPRVHLDLHVPDPATAVAAAVAVGARPVDGNPVGYAVLESPGGLTFCVVSQPAAAHPRVVSWPGGHHSQVYGVCLDLPRAAYDAELAFWTALLGARWDVLQRRPEFGWLRPPRSWMVDLLVQRLDEPTGRVRGHLDLGSTDRAAEVARHVGLGARIESAEEFWTVLRDPSGLPYCVTDRDPVTRRMG